MTTGDSYRLVEWHKRMDEAWSDHEYERITLAAIGSAGVGKTSFLYRLLRGEFNDKRVSTVSVDYMEKLIMARHPHYDEKIRVTLTDTIGDDKLWHACVTHLKRASGVFLCFDTTDSQSLDACKRWVELLRQDNEHAVCMLVGLKLDKYDELSKDKRWLDSIDLQAEAKRLGCEALACRVSSKSNTGIAEALVRLVDCAIEKQGQFVAGMYDTAETSVVDIAKKINTPRGKKCC